MSQPLTPSPRRAARAFLSLAALALAACGEASTAPAVTPADASPSLSVTGTLRALRYTQSCRGTTCTFDASTSSGFTSFRWMFGSGTPYGASTTVATTSFPATGTYMVMLYGTYPATATTRGGTAQVMKLVTCTNGNCF